MQQNINDKTLINNINITEKEMKQKFTPIAHRLADLLFAQSRQSCGYLC